MKSFGSSGFDRAYAILTCATLIVIGSICGGLPIAQAQSPAIAYVQGANAVPQSPQSTVTTVFSATQTAGNLNVVVVGWNDSVAKVQSVNDTRGNSYLLAVGPTVSPGFASQSIYYAKNIVASAANTNTVTVIFDIAAQYVDLRIAEYSGLDLSNPVDVVAAASGSGSLTNSGAVTTTNANDLLVGANLVSTTTTGPGTSFTSRMITNPDGDILEDRIVSATGSYSATAPISPAGFWIMQMVAFRAAGSGPPPPADLTVTKTHSGSFTAGQIGAQYSLTVRNSGGSATNGPVSVTDTLPSGLTATSIAGSGWNCTLSTLNCTRSDALAANSNYPDVTVTVNVASNAPPSVTNVAVVSGGGETNTGNNTASDITTITIPDTEPPSVPGTLTSTAIGGAQINLSWGVATDNVGVAGYRVERCQGASCSSFAGIGSLVTGTTFSDTGLSPNTSYSYIVRAEDTVGNLGPYSNTTSATTLATNPHLLAAYGFNEGAGTTLPDVTGNGNTGTIASGTWAATGKYGGALTFNGTSTMVTIPDQPALRLSTGMTLEAWVYPTVVTSAWRDVIYKGNDNYFLEATTTVNGVPAIGQIIGTSTYSEVYAPSPLATNTWTHLAATYDGANLRLYVNGVQVGSRAQTGAMLSTTNPLQIGGDTFYGQYFAGMIDEVRIYNVALTASEIQADMNTPLGGAGSPADLTVTKTHSGVFSTGQIGAQYTLSVTNAGQGATTGAVTVADTLPAGLTATAISGTGWTCTPATLSCTRSDTLGAGASYPNVTLTVNVAGNAAPSVTNVAAVSGGGETNTGNNTASDITTITSPDTEPPSAPGTLTSTAISGVQINLSWGAATDNVGVIGYRVERCQGVGCSNFVKFGTTVTGTTVSDTGLTPDTSYSYIIRAEDAVGNLGPYSNITSATTLATNPHLLAAYAFNESAGTILNDVTGNGNTGTIASGTWSATGKYGGALTFNGASTTVTIPDQPALRLSTGMTLEAWVYPTVVNSAWRDVIYKGNDNYFLEATTTANGVPAIGQIIGTSTYSEVYAPSPLATNTWTHLAATYDGANLRLYINGVQVGSRAQTGAMLSTTNPLQIGGNTFYGQYFAGVIDEVRIYDVALTPSEIQTDMSTPIGSTNLPVISLSTNSINFGSQQVGIPTSPTSVTVTNIGGSALSITNIAWTGSHSSDFSQTNTCSSPVAVNGTCSISITFTPSAVGLRTATVAITDNAPGSPHTIAVTGTGEGFTITPQLSVLTPGQQQQFTASGPGSGSVTWLVDGGIGGSAASGLITSAGVYTAPALVGTHIVSATNAQSIVANATAHIVNNPGVFTHHYDNSRTGANTTEVVLTPANVNSTSFGKLLSYQTDGISHASPLYVAGVNIPGVGIRNVVYVSTEHDSVYAFDADGLSTNPLWKRSFINPPAVTTVPNLDTGECCDIVGEIGITGTPVIDPSTGTLYVVVKTKESGAYVQRLHAINIATGANKLGGPVVIEASVPGNGVGSSNGQVPFDHLRESQRTGLLLHNGVIYFGFGSHGDNQPYHGWIFAYNATTLQKLFAYNTTPNGEGGGVWHSGGGLVVDAGGNIHFITSDGTFDANTGGLNYGDSYMKLSPTGAVLDYFTPHDQGIIDANNLDLGAGGLILLPDQPGSHPHLLVSGGKNGSVYLVDRDNMGHFNATTNTNVQTLSNIFPFGTPLPGNYSSPVYFNGKVYFGPIADSVQAFALTNGLLSTSPVSRTIAAFAYPGASLSISANGTTNAILWALEKKGASPGTLRAYDATNLQVELYNSDQAGTRDVLDAVAKFTVPTVVNGKVFVVTEGTLAVFGLLP